MYHLINGKKIKHRISDVILITYTVFVDYEHRPNMPVNKGEMNFQRTCFRSNMSTNRSTRSHLVFELCYVNII